MVYALESLYKRLCCNQRKQYGEPSIMLDKNTTKALTDVKFLVTLFDRTLSYQNHVDYLKTNCLKALDILKVVGHTDWGPIRKHYSVSIEPS